MKNGPDDVMPPRVIGQADWTRHIFQAATLSNASKGDPLFASNTDPLGVLECRVSADFGAVIGNGLLERLERREGVARLEFQPLQQPILFPAGRGVSCGF